MLKRVQRVVEEMQAARLITIKGRGVIATCVEGRIWITRDNERVDTVLEAGSSFETSSSDRVILQALIPSRITLHFPVRPSFWAVTTEGWKRFFSGFGSFDQSFRSAWRR